MRRPGRVDNDNFDSKNPESESACFKLVSFV